MTSPISHEVADERDWFFEEVAPASTQAYTEEQLAERGFATEMRELADEAAVPAAVGSLAALVLSGVVYAGSQAVDVDAWSCGFARNFVEQLDEAIAEHHLVGQTEISC